MFVVTVTYIWACLYIALCSVPVVRLVTHRTVHPPEKDLRNTDTDPKLNLTGSSVLSFDQRSLC